MGLTLDQTLDLPFGQLLDLMAIQLIKTEGAKLKQKEADDEDAFFELLKRR